MEFKKPDVFSTNWHMEAVKNYSFRGRIVAYIPNLVTIKVSSRRSRTILKLYFKANGPAGYHYNIQLLGWFECWFPRYQIEG